MYLDDLGKIRFAADRLMAFTEAGPGLFRTPIAEAVSSASRRD